MPDDPGVLLRHNTVIFQVQIWGLNGIPKNQVTECSYKPSRRCSAVAMTVL